MLKFILNFFVSKPKYNFVFEEDAAYGGYMVYAKEWPHVTAVGKTKHEALKSLLEDIELIQSVNKEQCRVPKRSSSTSFSSNSNREVAANV